MINVVLQNHIMTVGSQQHSRNCTNLHRSRSDDTGGIVVDGGDLSVATGVDVQECAAVAKCLQQYVDGCQLLGCKNASASAQQ